MASQSEAFFEEIHRMIETDVDAVIDVILARKPKEMSSLIVLDDEQINRLHNITLDEFQVIALKKAFQNMARGLVSSIFCIIDGVSNTPEDIPNLVLVNRKTGKPINDDFLHDEFFDSMPDE